MANHSVIFFHFDLVDATSEIILICSSTFSQVNAHFGH